MNSPLLDIRHLSIGFQTNRGLVQAVDDVSLTVATGETLGLVGESGCGKSVTALSVLNLIPTPPARFGSDSTIRFGDQDILTLRGEALRQIRGGRIGMIFQEPTTSLNPVLTVGSQIAETIRAHTSVTRRESWERAVELLRTVGIADPGARARDYPHQMSGGMQQRVMIAIALSCNPELLIADEPTTALDVTVQAQILELLTDLKERLGMAVLFITHDLSVVASLADRVAVMYAGRIVEVAPTADLFDEPRHPYTRGLLRAIPRVHQPGGTLSGIPGSVPRPTALPLGCRFHPRCPDVMDRCRQDDPPVTVTGSRHVSCWLETDTGGDDA